jgi:alkanesulfonate monooxygenase
MWSGDETPFKGRHYQLERPLNSPQSLSRPHPRIIIGGSGERKTLRLVAQHADACNLFPGDIPHKLAVLRGHCDAVGRDYDEIEKTSMVMVDPADIGGALESLRQLAGLGIQMVYVGVKDVDRPEVLDVLGQQLIPAAERL